MTEQTAAEWLEAAGKQRDAEDDWLELQTALAMLRDAKAELDKVAKFERFVAPLEPLREATEFAGWDAIEAKWREGGYR